MHNLRKYSGLLIVALVSAIFILAFSGCSKDNDTTTPNITGVTNTIPTASNSTINTDDEVVQNDVSTQTTPPAESTPTTNICGNNELELEEQCDGSVPQGITCQSEGFDNGLISCTPVCTLNLSVCTHTTSCTDTDDGLNYAVQGTVTIDNNGTIKAYTDYCRQTGGPFDGYVFEYYCVNDSVASENYDCPEGCNNNGACYP
jgi:hypothetical protein